MNKEITIELTNYCPHNCKYCSSMSTNKRYKALWIEPSIVIKILGNKQFEHIIISGGEPLAHPDFYDILEICKQHTKDVIVYSNAINHIAYNSSVIDGIYVEAKVTVNKFTNKIGILKRIEQGKEAIRPEVTFSRNYDDNCIDCNHIVIRPDGQMSSSPCNKKSLDKKYE